mmetsp:Transcript_15148/g.15341  ORF Transcript_15148/g.15341 Transcript_15148/m.15341 type:complete len:100 (-) Transcript_15148:360-659(-)
MFYKRVFSLDLNTECAISFSQIFKPYRFLPAVKLYSHFLLGMSELVKERPPNPIDWLAAYLLRNNPQGQSAQQQAPPPGAGPAGMQQQQQMSYPPSSMP